MTDSLPDGFDADALAFVPPEYLDDPDSADGLWHVTVALDRVLTEGLRSRRQLGRAVQGLGGGHNDQAPDLVSLTWSSGKAAEIEAALTLAARAARDLVPASEIFNATAERYGTDDFGVHVRSTLATLGVPPDITEDDWLDGLDVWLDDNVSGGEAKYALLQTLDDAMEREFDRSFEFPSRVGLTAPFDRIAAIDPDQIGTVRVAVRTGARCETVGEEMELRFHPADLAVLGPAHTPEEEPEPAGLFAR